MQKIPCEPQVGADVELFVSNVETGGIVPCVGIIPGTKERPFVPDGVKAGYALQEDNVMLEFNIPPLKTARGASKTLMAAHEMIRTELKKHSLEPQWKPAHTFRAVQLTSLQAKTFGCSPDFDAYQGARMRTGAPEFGRQRFCGGHIHLGGNFRCPDFVAALFAELFLMNSITSWWADQGEPKKATTKAKPPLTREDWYGLPGTFRPKPYGIEYRTPDNMWAADWYLGEVMLSAALECAKYLTGTPADQLQRAFREIPWLKQREGKMSKSFEIFVEARDAARNAGVPV